MFEIEDEVYRHRCLTCHPKQELDEKETFKQLTKYQIMLNPRLRVSNLIMDANLLLNNHHLNHYILQLIF